MWLCKALILGLVAADDEFLQADKSAFVELGKKEKSKKGKWNMKKTALILLDPLEDFMGQNPALPVEATVAGVGMEKYRYAGQNYAEDLRQAVMHFRSLGGAVVVYSDRHPKDHSSFLCTHFPNHQQCGGNETGSKKAAKQRIYFNKGKRSRLWRCLKGKSTCASKDEKMFRMKYNNKKHRYLQFMYPEHAVKNTQGAGLFPGLCGDVHGLHGIDSVGECTVDQAPGGGMFRKGGPAVHFTFSQTNFDNHSAFVSDRINDPANYPGMTGTAKREAASSGVATWLHSRGIEQVVVMGISIDGKAENTALDAKKFGFRSYIVQSMIRKFDPKYKKEKTRNFPFMLIPTWHMLQKKSVEMVSGEEFWKWMPKPSSTMMNNYGGALADVGTKKGFQKLYKSKAKAMKKLEKKMVKQANKQTKKQKKQDNKIAKREKLETVAEGATDTDEKAEAKEGAAKDEVAKAMDGKTQTKTEKDKAADAEK